MQKPTRAVTQHSTEDIVMLLLELTCAGVVVAARAGPGQAEGELRVPLPHQRQVGDPARRGDVGRVGDTLQHVIILHIVAAWIYSRV